jgi:hypothetical protein
VWWCGGLDLGSLRLVTVVFAKVGCAKVRRSMVWTQATASNGGFCLGLFWCACFYHSLRFADVLSDQASWSSVRFRMPLQGKEGFGLDNQATLW